MSQSQLLFYPNERTSIFIDGRSLFHTARKLDFEVDLSKFSQYFASKFQLVRCSYYTPVSEERTPLHNILDWLSYNGFTVSTRVFSPDNHPPSISSLMSVDIIEQTLGNGYAGDEPYALQHVVIVSGDGDYCPVVKFLKSRSIRVSVMSSLETEPLSISEELRRLADNFIELDDLRSELERHKKTSA